MDTHRTYIRKRTGDTAILMVHGILGTPNHFNFLLDLIPEDWSVCNLLLDGHGKTVRDFSRSSMRRWEEQVIQAAAALSARHQNVLIAAHSMGALLAIDCALQNTKVKRLFLLAPPLRIAPKPRALSAALRVVWERVPSNDPFVVASKNAYSIQPDKRLWRYIGWIPRYLELFRKSRQIRNLIPALQTPAKVFLSRRDELVSMRTERHFREHPAVSFSVLEHSGHHDYDACDKAVLRDQFSAFICG